MAWQRDQVGKEETAVQGWGQGGKGQAPGDRTADGQEEDTPHVPPGSSEISLLSLGQKSNLFLYSCQIVSSRSQ